MSPGPFFAALCIGAGLILAIAAFLRHEPPLRWWQALGALALAALLFALGATVLVAEAKGH